VQAAQKICAACPVQIQCAEYAQHIGAGHGVWGGRHITSGTYRPVMFPPPHGTEARARWDLRHNIVPCVECHHAAAEAARSRRQAHTGGSQR
jgi:hypothetical protein